jgi:hypothetical protein
MFKTSQASDVGSIPTAPTNYPFSQQQDRKSGPKITAFVLDWGFEDSVV